MMKIVIVENMESERRILREFLLRYGTERSLDLEIVCFADGAEVVDRYPSGVDLILMDIDMDEMDGVTAARHIRARDEKVELIFVTRMVQYALEGYEVSAADFLIKPLSYTLFAQRLDRVMKKIKSHERVFIELHSKKETLRQDPAELLCVEALNKRTYLHTSAGETIEIREPLYEVEKMLPAEGFYRCHNAYVVNLSKILRFSAAEVMLPGMNIPVSKHRKKEFFEALAGYRGSMI